ncbi:MAG: cobalamin biosynthesis protein [Rhodobacteraceae bacterium]|nr:cobalamin biosynthesis protein [Paracoccaceae bacterium]
MTTAMMLVAAMLLDAALGEPRWLWSRLPHPAVLMGRVVSALEHRLNRGQDRRLKGLLATGVLVLTGLGIGLILSLFGPVVEVIIAAFLLAQRSLVQHVDAVSQGLRLSLEAGRRAVSMIVSRNTEEMTAPQVARSAIESAAENLSDGVVAPAFWFLIAGLPGLIVYKFVNTADSMIGYRTPRYEQFGKVSARLDDLLNLIPARLTGVLIALIGGQMGQWYYIRRDAKAHKSPNAGWPEAAMARALDLALAGPRSYDGQMRDLAWVNGTARKSIGAPEIDGAVAILWKVWAACLVLTVALAVLF